MISANDLMTLLGSGVATFIDRSFLKSKVENTLRFFQTGFTRAFHKLFVKSWVRGFVSVFEMTRLSSSYDTL